VLANRVARWYIFKPKNPNLGKFWEGLGKCWYFVAVLSILRSKGIFYGHLVRLVGNWCIFPRYGMLYREISGNPCLSMCPGGSVILIAIFGPIVGMYKPPKFCVKNEKFCLIF
jgi:hypothetical protein